MNRLVNRLAKTNVVLYSIFLWVVSFVLRGAVNVIQVIFRIPDVQFRAKPVDENLKITLDLLLNGLILAPLIESLLFQTLFFSLYKRFRINKWVIILLSTVLFGLYHNYSIFYIVNTGIVGFLFMYFYILRAEQENKPFFATVVAHVFFNFAAIVIILFKHYFKFGTWF